MTRYWLLIAALLLQACSSEDSPPAQKLAEKSFVDVMQQAESEAYPPPRDGRLSEQQVAMYVAVKQREAELAEVAATNLSEKSQALHESGGGSEKQLAEGFQAMSDLADYATLDIRAAQELGYNSGEYQWVRDTIIETNARGFNEEMDAGLMQIQNELLKQFEERRRTTTDPALLEIIDSQIRETKAAIAELEKNNTESTEEKATFAHNRDLIAKYADKLDVIAAETNKWRLLNQEESGTE